MNAREMLDIINKVPYFPDVDELGYSSYIDVRWYETKPYNYRYRLHIAFKGTLSRFWLLRWDTIPPDTLKRLDDIKLGDFAIDWIRKKKINVPRQYCLRSLTPFQPFHDTCASVCIEVLKKEPDEWMRHSSEYICRDGRTLAMSCITTLRRIPYEWMKHNPKLTDNKNKTCAMLCIINLGIEPLDWMYHDENITDDQGNTLAMLYVRYLKKEPPERMHHDPRRKNILNMTLQYLWILFVKTLPPEWMHHENSLSCGPNDNCKALWIRIVNENPPEYLDS